MIRFDKPCVVVAGAVEYFREHMVVGDYLTQGGSAEMTWAGGAAGRQALTGQCQLTHFESLCRGLHPLTGERLMVRDKGEHRRVCYFGQISPPKDVSVLHLVGGDARIAGWWEEAVAETLRELEALTATRVRRAAQNFDRRTGNFVAALVTHDTNRALDPQLHTHICVMNLTYDEAEARWKSIQPSAFYRHQAFLREVCYNKLAQLMTAAGYALEPSPRIGFTVRGFPSELRQLFSKRRREILRLAEEARATSQDELQAITAHSRSAKTKATAASLREAWLREAAPHLAALQAIIAGAQGHPVRQETRITARDAVASASAHVFERHSVVDDRLLLREALIAGRGQVSLDALRRAMSACERTGTLIRIGDEIAVREGLEAEREFTGWANSQQRGRPRLGTTQVTPGLGAEQATAVREVLGSTSGVVILQGDAGTGKTTSLRFVVAGIERAGGRVFGCAPSSGAAEVLRQELTADADTLQQLLVNEALQQKTRGRVLLVDEAGLISVRQMRDLCRLAARNGNRLLLVGDIKQHMAVEAGDALRCLQEFARVPVVHLTEIWRQQNPEYRKVVARLAAGDAFGAFKRLEALGAVREISDERTLLGTAADDFVRALRAGKTCLAISPVWSEIKAFNAEIRPRLRAGGYLSGQDRTVTTVDLFKWTREERRRVENYRPGDVLVFHRDEGELRKFETVVVRERQAARLLVERPDGREYSLEPRRSGGFAVGSVSEIAIAAGDRLLIRANVRPARFRNGDLVEVAALESDGSIRLKDGRSIPSWFREFTYGYAMTSHASQGKTVERGFLLMAEEGIAAGNLKQAYVSNSRFRDSQTIYTTDRKAVREAMMRPSDRKLAMEMVSDEGLISHPSPRARWLSRFTPWFKQSAA